MEPCQVQSLGNQKKGLLELSKEVKPNAPWDDVLPHTLDDNVLPLVAVDRWRRAFEERADGSRGECRPRSDVSLAVAGLKKAMSGACVASSVV